MDRVEVFNRFRVFNLVRKRAYRLAVPLILSFLACFLSLMRLPGLHPPLAGQFIVFSLCSSVLLIWICWQLRKVSFLHINIVDILLFILFIVILINCYLLQPNYGTSIVFFEMIGLGVIYFAIRSINDKFYLCIFIAVVLGGGIQSIYGQLQLSGYIASNHNIFLLTGSFFNPGPLGGYLASTFPIALGLFCYLHSIKNVTSKKDILRYILIIAILIIALTIILTKSRASWVATLTSIIILILLRLKNKTLLQLVFKSIFNKVVFFLFFTIISLGITLWISNLKQDSSNGRLLIWKISYTMILDDPLLGQGFDLFKAHYMNYQAKYSQSFGNEKSNFLLGDIEYAFNEFIQFTAENGLIAFAIGVLILFQLFTSSSTKNPNLIIARVGLLSCLIFSFFSYPSYILSIKLNCIIFVGVISSNLKNYTFCVRIGSIVKIARHIFCLSLFAFIFIIFSLEKFYQASEYWFDAHDSNRQGLYKNASDSYSKAYHMFDQNGKFLFEYGQVLKREGNFNKSLILLTRGEKYYNSSAVQIAKGDVYRVLKMFDLAEYAYLMASQMVPERFYPKYLLAKLYMEMHEYSKAKKIATELIDKRIRVRSAAAEEITKEMQELIIELDNK